MLGAKGRPAALGRGDGSLQSAEGCRLHLNWGMSADLRSLDAMCKVLLRHPEQYIPEQLSWQSAAIEWCCSHRYPKGAPSARRWVHMGSGALTWSTYCTKRPAHSRRGATSPRPMQPPGS